MLRRVGEKAVIFKPAPGPKGLREVRFYERIFHSHPDDAPGEILTMKELVPYFCGTHDIIDRAGETCIL